MHGYAYEPVCVSLCVYVCVQILGYANRPHTKSVVSGGYHWAIHLHPSAQRAVQLLSDLLVS